MKKIHILICMIALLSVTSCVNLDLNPPSAASSENWFSSPEYNRQIKKFPTEKQNVSLKHILT